jgi:hypothetical protein
MLEFFSFNQRVIELEASHTKKTKECEKKTPDKLKTFLSIHGPTKMLLYCFAFAPTSPRKVFGHSLCSTEHNKTKSTRGRIHECLVVIDGYIRLSIQRNVEYLSAIFR